MDLIYKTRNKVELLSAAFAVLDGQLHQGQLLGFSIFRFAKSNDVGLLLFDDARTTVWKAKISGINFEETSPEVVTFHDVETGKIYPVRFASLEEREKSLSFFTKSQQIAKGKAELMSEDEQDGGVSELEDARRCLAMLSERVKQLEIAYQSDFVVKLTTETVSSLWLQTKEILENANVSAGTQQAVQSSMVSFAAQKNAEHAPSQRAPNLTEARSNVQIELSRLRDLLGHTRLTSSESSSARARPKQNDSDGEREDREDEEARIRGANLAKALQPAEADLPRREGWLEHGRKSSWKKMYCKSVGRFMYAFEKRGETVPKLSIPLIGSKVSNEEGLVMLITTPGSLERKIRFRASSNEDFNDWVYALSILTGQ